MHDRIDEPGTVWLDTALADAVDAQGLLFTRPRRVIEAATPEEVLPALDAVDQAVADGFFVAGYIAYEAAHAFLPTGPGMRVPYPLVWFGVYEEPLPVSAGLAGDPSGQDANGVSGLAFSQGKGGYLSKLEQVKRHIREGDVYQVNFTGAMDFTYTANPLALYRSIRERQRVRYGAFLNAGGRHILSFSPELFFRRRGPKITVRPMKGTVHRGRTPEEDDTLARWLAADPKSQAENLMIVDLLRNDLSICCEPGSVQVRDLFATERYETLIQMTSTVEGTLQPAVKYAELLQALFPCGSVTGAPKIRAMQIIRDLETRPRGVYCGAIGYIAPHGESEFNVAIRTLVLEDGRGTLGVGSGIVWDSDPEAEYAECLLKSAFMTPAPFPPFPLSPSLPLSLSPPHPHPSTPPNSLPPAFHLIETMKAEDGTVPLLEMHLDRLARSAAYFGIALDEPAIRAAVEEEIARWPGGKALKVRLTLDTQGKIEVTSSELAIVSPGVKRACIGAGRIDPADNFVYHKTSRRQHYEAAYVDACRQGYDEVIFLNSRGEVAEGSRSNIFVRFGAQWYTPPVSAGLLPGVYRRHVLKTNPHASERTLTPEDLLSADEVYICNAVRGLVPVVIEDAPRETA